MNENSETSADDASTIMNGTAGVSGDTSILNNSVLSETPEVVTEEEIQACLEFVKQFHIDEKLQSSSKGPPLMVKGESAWCQLPFFIRRRVRDQLAILDDDDVPSTEDITKALSYIATDKHHLDYNEYVTIHSNFPESVKKLFDPCDLWGKLFGETDKYGRLPISTFRELFIDRINYLRYRSSLESFSYAKIGYLNFDELRTFIIQMSDQFGFFEDNQEMAEIVPEAFSELIFFKAGGLNRDYVKITDVLICGAIADIFNFKGDDIDNETSYFTVASVKKCYDRYNQTIGETAPGMTKQQIYSAFDSIVPAFWDRYFELYCPDDYIYFIDFFKISYMLDNLLDTNVIRLFFRVLDRDDDGIFSIRDYKPFHSQLMTAYCIKYGYNFDIDFVYDSLFDLALSKEHITLKAVLETKRFDEFFGMACDVECFAKLENAEPVDVEVNEVTSEE